MGAGTGAAATTFTYKPLRWAVNGGNGGPVISPEIVPLYWGKNSATQWVSGSGVTDDDPNLVNAYIDNLANFVSGVNLPTGLEPVTKQYGVWGAQRLDGKFTCTGACSAGDSSIADVGIVGRIGSLQQKGVLPPSTASRIFLVLLKGFSYQFPANWAGYHSQNGVVYAVVFADRCPSADGSTTGCSLQQVITHELFEAMTDTYPNNGWAYTNPTDEGGDECEPWSGAGSAGIAALPWGFPQTFADNVTGGCSMWSWTSTSPLALSNWPSNGDVVDAFYPSPGWTGQPGTLMHAFTQDGVNWSSEPAGPDVGPFSLVLAPTAVKPNANRIDVFSRGVTGTSTGLFHFSKVVGGSWTETQIPDGISMGQISAVSPATNRIDLAALGRDSSVIHFSSTDNTTFSRERIASQTMGPPTIVSLNNTRLEIHTYGMHADQVVAGNNAIGQPFGSFGTIVPGVNGLIPMPPAVAVFNTNQRVVMANTNGGSDSSFEEQWTYQPRYTTTNTNGGYAQSYFAFGNTTPWGAYAAVANSNGVDVAWMDRASFSFNLRHFNVLTHSWSQINSAANWDTIVPLGGQFLAPPVLAYGTDGALYVLGVGFDGCLYQHQVIGGSDQGLSWTGVCGVM